MSQLTQISIVTKKLLIWVLLAFLGYLGLKFVYDASVLYWKNTHPKPFSFTNETIFGKIPTPKFMHVATSSSGFKFILENVEGLPIKDATPAGKIYAMPKKLPTLLDAQKSRDFVKKLGFINPEEPINSTYFRFTDPADKLRTIEIDITTKNFKLKYDYIGNPSIFTGEIIQNKNQAITDVKNYAQFNSLFDDSILRGKQTVSLYTLDTQTKVITSATSLSSANLIRINFFRSDLDGKKIIPPLYDESYNYALYTPSSNIDRRIIELVYTFWPISFDEFGSYPLRSSEMAWQDLADGYAYIIKLGNNTSENQIIIRNIYLAYYDSEEPQNYLQPVYGFEGDNDFVALLPAVSSDWLE